MKIPSEAELIEMERRAGELPAIAERLDRAAQSCRDKAESSSEPGASLLFAKSRKFERQEEAASGLVGDVERLVALVRSLRSEIENRVGGK